MAVLMPRMRPAASTSAPPELPGLMAASVWMRSTSATPCAGVTVRPSALTMPEVTLPSSPNGEPIATTGSPTAGVASASAQTGTGRSLASTRSTARSEAASTPTTSASRRSPSGSVTTTCAAPSTTCALVTSTPSDRRTTPEPEPAPNGPWASTRATDGLT
jgi:hypothetical protein